jgi:DnaJ-class molecular chaperone
MRMEPTEIVALARIIDELDYYQLLHLRRDAGSGDVKRAFHASSRSFHPDANRHLQGEVREASRVVAKRITEAYAVLRDPRRRQAYDRHLHAGDPVRIQLAEAEADAGRRSTEERVGRTAQGRQFYKLAEADIARSNWAAAARNLQTALTFEPDNEVFKQRLSEARNAQRSV